MVIGNVTECDWSIRCRRRCRRRDVNTADIGVVQHDDRSVGCLANQGFAGDEIRHHVATVWRTDNDPSVVVVNQHTLCTNVKPNPAVFTEVGFHERRNRCCFVINTGLHTICTPGDACGRIVPCGAGLTPLGVGDSVNIEGHGVCTTCSNP